MFKTIMWQFYGVKGAPCRVLGAAPLERVPRGNASWRGLRGSAPGGVRGSAPGGGPASQSAGPTVNPLPCLIGELSFKILNVNEISQSNYEFLNLFKTYWNIQLKLP